MELDLPAEPSKVRLLPLFNTQNISASSLQRSEIVKSSFPKNSEMLCDDPAVADCVCVDEEFNSVGENRKRFIESDSDESDTSSVFDDEDSDVDMPFDDDEMPAHRQIIIPRGKGRFSSGAPMISLSNAGVLMADGVVS
jgi:hypothetical protein